MFFEFILLFTFLGVLNIIETKTFVLYALVCFLLVWVHDLQKKVERLCRENIDEKVKVAKTYSSVQLLKQKREVVANDKVEDEKKVVLKEEHINKKVEIVDNYKKFEEDIIDVSEKQEKNFLVWVAGFAAILGVFFLVRFLVSHGILSPQVRLLLLTIGASFAIWGGNKLFYKEDFADSKRISQVLISIGIVALYFVSYALSKLYFITSVGVSFVLMCGVTLLAMHLVTKIKEQPIAILTLLGGFLTPSLVYSFNEGAVFLSSFYLLMLFGVVVYSGVFVVSSLIVLLMFGGIYLWAFLLLFMFDFQMLNTVWIMMLVIGTLLISSFSKTMSDNTKNSGIAMVGCFIFSIMCLAKTNFGTLEWGMCALLLSLFVYLSIIRSGMYLVQTIFCSVGIVILMYCSQFYNKIGGSMYAIMSVVAILPYYLILLKKFRNVYLAVYLAVICPAYYLVAYYLFRDVYFISYIGFGACLLLLVPYFCNRDDDDISQKISGLMILSGAMMLSLSLCMLLSNNLLVMFAAIEILVFSLIKDRLNIRFAEYGLFAICIWLVYLLRDAIWKMLLLILPFNVWAWNAHFDGNSLTGLRLIVYGIVPLMCFVASYMLCKQDEMRAFMKKLVAVFGLSVLFLAIIMLKMSAKDIVYYNIDISDYVIITDLILLFLLFVCKNNGPLYICGGIIAFFRLLVMCSMIFVPIYASGKLNVPYTVFIYVIPMSLLYLISQRNKEIYNFAIKVIAGLSFVLVTSVLNINFYGHPSFGGQDLTSGALFLYSLVWLILGVLWLASAFYVDIMIKPAFGLIYFVVAKIFLYDVSNLNEFWRIISLFALAGVLLLVSHVYAKNFKNNKLQEDRMIENNN